MRDEKLFQRASDLLILTEGYITYGGLAGRELEAMAQRFVEVLDEDHLNYRIRRSAYVGEKLLDAGIQIVAPPGGHAIYIDAAPSAHTFHANTFRGRHWSSASIVTPVFGRARSAR